MFFIYSFMNRSASLIVLFLLPFALLCIGCNQSTIKDNIVEDETHALADEFIHIIKSKDKTRLLNYIAPPETELRKELEIDFSRGKSGLHNHFFGSGKSIYMFMNNAENLQYEVIKYDNRKDGPSNATEIIYYDQKALGSLDGRPLDELHQLGYDFLIIPIFFFQIPEDVSNHWYMDITGHGYFWTLSEDDLKGQIPIQGSQSHIAKPVKNIKRRDLFKKDTNELNNKVIEGFISIIKDNDAGMFFDYLWRTDPELFDRLEAGIMNQSSPTYNMFFGSEKSFYVFFNNARKLDYVIINYPEYSNDNIVNAFEVIFYDKSEIQSLRGLDIDEFYRLREEFKLISIKHFQYDGSEQWHHDYTGENGLDALSDDELKKMFPIK